MSPASAIAWSFAPARARGLHRSAEQNQGLASPASGREEFLSIPDARLEASESDQESIGSQESGGVRSAKEAIIPN
jgi:hypothetical protein